MPNLVLEIVSIFAYAIVLNVVWHSHTSKERLPLSLISIFSTSVLLHGYIAYLHIDVENGQNLGLFNVLVMTTWISGIIVLGNLVKYKSTTLVLFSTPFSIISILGVSIFKGNVPIAIQGNNIQLLHVLLGITAMSVLILAAILSSLILYIDKKLRSSPSSLNPGFESLQSLERYLYQLLISGFIIMTVTLTLASFLPEESLQTQVLQKVALTVASWFILAILILGHFLKGWRGVFAAKWTLMGVTLLLLGYFGSKSVLEFLVV